MLTNITVKMRETEEKASCPNHISGRQKMPNWAAEYMKKPDLCIFHIR